MTPDDWKRLQDLFHAACALPSSARHAFIETETAGAPVLRQELISMLHADQAATAALEAPLQEVRAGMDRLSNEIIPPGTRLGPWEVTRLLGAGGMGRVYLGQRADGAYERQVAIKLIGWDGGSTLRREQFQFERRLLAHMQHPAIAQIHDAGNDEHGRLYLVMEYVEGLSLTQWCETHQLGLRERVALMIRVAEGVQHAHQKGVIHRDLKPGNVLVASVDGVAMPKIIDFGIASATDETGESPVATAGTPGYMSPEQAGAGTDIDSRSDVYSLGALLYELISGQRPQRGEIATTAPLRPSRELATLSQDEISRHAARCNTAPRRLMDTVRHDLDWIVARATQPAREWRYSGADAFAADLQRWLDGRLPEAAPRQRLRALRKFISRHRTASVAAILLAIAILGGWMATSRALHRAEQAIVREQVTNRFLSDVLTSVDPAQANQMDKALMRQVLGNASQRAATELTEQPEALARVNITLAQTYVNLGDLPKAIDHAEKAWQVSREQLGPDSESALASSVELGHLLTLNGQLDRAETLMRQALPHADAHSTRQPVLGPRLRSRLGWLLHLQGKDQEAQPLLRDGHAQLVERVGADHPRSIDAGQYYAVVQAALGEKDEAIALMRDLVARRTELLGPEHPQTLALRNSLAAFYAEAGQLEASAQELRGMIDTVQTQKDIDAMMLPVLQANLAITLQRIGSVGAMTEASPLFENAIARFSALQGPQAPNTLMVKQARIDWLMADARWSEARDEQIALLADMRHVFGPGHPKIPALLAQLAQAEQALGHGESAINRAREALTLLDESDPDNAALHRQLRDMTTTQASP